MASRKKKRSGRHTTAPRRCIRERGETNEKYYFLKYTQKGRGELCDETLKKGSQPAAKSKISCKGECLGPQKDGCAGEKGEGKPCTVRPSLIKKETLL